MQASQIPLKIPEPFANAQSSTYNNYPLPDTVAGGSAAASWHSGFGSLTSLTAGAGGTPPSIQDFNAIFQGTSAWGWWLGAGGPVTYDSAYSSTIGGYPKGAVVQSATTFRVAWLCLADNNTSNPDTGGANWQKIGTLSEIRIGGGTVTSGTLSVSFSPAFVNASPVPIVLITDAAANGWSATNFSVYGAYSINQYGFTVNSVRWNGSTFIAQNNGVFSYFAYIP